MLIDTSIPVAIHNKELGYQELIKTISTAKRRGYRLQAMLNLSS